MTSFADKIKKSQRTELYRLAMNALASGVCAGAALAALGCMFMHLWQPATAFFVWSILMRTFIRD